MAHEIRPRVDAGVGMENVTTAATASAKSAGASLAAETSGSAHAGNAARPPSRDAAPSASTTRPRSSASRTAAFPARVHPAPPPVVDGRR